MAKRLNCIPKLQDYHQVNLSAWFADDPMEKIELKTFHCQIQNDHDLISVEEKNYQSIPGIRTMIKADIGNLVENISRD